MDRWAPHGASRIDSMWGVTVNEVRYQRELEAPEEGFLNPAKMENSALNALASEAEKTGNQWPELPANLLSY